ncbi:lasso peptide biosynthesis B2 protein [Streptomyces sp. TP-A0874]|uniref:lasso peptide biosynthesis B2 protein n=1 Tax=Streptomyces sp. TP-A0874 TaxID=549819 RepID=UPI0008529A72|nr:lasso peptide biosynthesis B2 protein [Streptomyces sp. TP-A0874]
MSVTIALRQDGVKRPFRLRLLTRLAIWAGRLLALLKPHRLRRVLVRLSKGVPPAGVEEVREAREAVLAASLSLNGLRACLPRSLSIVMLCRFQGRWPTWSVGVRSMPPFLAHAWVEVGREMIGEKGGYDSFSRLITVPPAEPAPVPPSSSGASGEPAASREETG